MAIDPRLAVDVIRVAGLIAERDRRAKGLSAAPPPAPPLTLTPPAPPPREPGGLGLPTLDFLQPVAEVIQGRPSIGTGGGNPRPVLAPLPAAAPPQTPKPAPTTPAAPPTPVVNAFFDQVGSQLSSGLGTAAAALDAPRGMVVSDIGEDMYRRATGQQSAPEVFAREQIPVISAAMDWAVRNPEKVIAAQEQGFKSRDGSITYTGGRAVWEAYARETQTGNLQGAATSFATDPLNLIGGPAGRAGRGLAARGAQIAADSPIAGRALTGVGKTIALPDVAIEQGIDLAKQGAGALARGAQRTPGIDRVAAQVGRLFQASPQAQAARRLNAWQAANMAEQAAHQGRVATPLAGVADDIAAAAAPAYEEAFSAVRSSRQQAGARAEAKLNTLAKAAPDQASRQAIDAIWRELSEARADILSTTEAVGRGAGRDIRNAANRAELWLTEFDAESRARDILAQSGGAPPPYRNTQPRGSMAADLDTLAWNPAREVADAAGQRVRAMEEEARRILGDESTVTNNLRAAREAAEANRGRIAGQEMGSATAASMPATPSTLATIAPQTTLPPQGALTTTAPAAGLGSAGQLETAPRQLATGERAIYVGTQPDDYPVRIVEVEPGRFEVHYAARAAAGGAHDYEWLRSDLPGIAGLIGSASFDDFLGHARSMLNNVERLRQRIAKDEIPFSSTPLGKIDPDLDIQRRYDEMADWEPVPADAIDPQVRALPSGPSAAAADPAAHLADFPKDDQAAWLASLNEAGGRQAVFAAADARLRQTREAIGRSFTAATDDDSAIRAVSDYQNAWQDANRLLEATKRADDAAAASAANLPPDVAQAILGEGAARTARDAADEAFTAGPIVAPEVSGFLSSPFAGASQYAGRAVGEVAGELRAALATQTARLGELLAQPRGLLDDAGRKELDKLLEQFPEAQRGGVQAIDAGAHLRRMMGEAFEEEAGYRAATGLGRTVDTASRIYSATNLLMPWTFPRYYLANMAGDTWQVLLAQGPQAAAAANNLGNLRDMTKYARGSGDPLVGAVGDVTKAWGLGGFHPTLVRENLAEALWARERKAINRAGGRARFNLLGTIDDATGLVTDPARNISNGLEWAHRTGLWAFLMDQEAVKRKAGFAREMAEYVGGYGIDEGDLRAILESRLRIDGGELADAVGRLAISRGGEASDVRGLAEEVGRRWASEVYKADEAARGRVNKALFSYEQKNADVLLRRVIPFHYWMSRAIPFYAEQALRHPGFAASYYRMYQATKEAAESEGWPAPLQTFMRIASGPGGMMLLLNPIATVGLMDFAFETNGGYSEENVSAVGQLLGRAGEYGFGLLPWWSSALNLTGYLGDSPVGLDPIGTHQARRFLGTMVQLAAGEGLLGPERQTLLDKPYEQMWQNVRDNLSGFLPGSMEIPASDPNAMPQVQLRNILLRQELEARGISVDDYLALAAAGQASATSPEALQVAEIHDAVAAAELDGGAAWQNAVRDFSRSNAIFSLISAVVPGPKKTRQEEGLAIQAVSSAAYAENPVIAGVGPIPEHDPAQLLDAADRAFIERWADRFGSDYRTGDLERMLEAAREANTLQNAPPETAAILGQQAAFYALGTERERQLLDGYYDILFAGGDVSLGGVSSAKLARGRGGRLWMSQAELAALSEDEREEIAEQWLRGQDKGRREVRRLRELRELYEQTHPEFAAYQSWQRETRDQWGGTAPFRAAAARANPNYARWLSEETSRLRRQGMTLSQINLELDSRALSLDAYLAYNGLRRSRYDPAPLPTGTPLPVASEGAPAGALGGEGGYPSGQSWDERVYSALDDTEAAMKASERHLGVRLDALPPPFQEGYLASADYPDAARPPSDFWIYEDYLNFANEATRAGTDGSVEAFIAATSREPGRLRERFEPNVWPPQPA